MCDNLQHMKDLISLRRNGVELLRCLQTAKKELSLCKSSHEEMSEREMILPRQRCLVVAQGLVSLLLSMDVTCHVDLLLVTCKVCLFSIEVIWRNVASFSIVKSHIP